LSSSLTRRQALELAAATPLLAWARAARAQAPGSDLSLADLQRSPSRVVVVGDRREAEPLRLTRTWDGALMRGRLENEGPRAVRVKEVVLFDVAHALAPETRLYGEGFQMLSQTGGSLREPRDLGDYTDAKHYKMPQPEDGSRVVHGVLTLSPPGAGHRLIAFTSCRRFNGQFYVAPDAFRVVVDTESRELAPGETWDLEELTFRSGADREALLGELGARLGQNHPRLPFPAPPAGWCSWYCFGPKVTAQQVLDNLDVIAREIPGLRYVQVDDGYQPAMGDWLLTGAAFGGDVRGVLQKIRAKGFLPAIWVAPFVAEKDSELFKQHPDWFVKAEDGAPLRSDLVTFGGWRRGPWYALDGTHPAAQQHLTHVFRTMREEWGCVYFKLDGNFWGAIHGGRFHDPKATRIEAYRRGMDAIRRGAGDAFILGCNHPIWPSLGLIHGSRSSNDIKRSWERISGTARQNLSRNWQNGRLWWNDADAVVLTGELSDDQFLFHLTAIYATGGMLLSGDDLTALPPARLALLKKLEPTGVAARFTDDSLQLGFAALRNRRLAFVLNWDESPLSVTIPLPGRCRIRDFFSDQDLGQHTGAFQPAPLPGRSGRLFVCTPAG